MCFTFYGSKCISRSKANLQHKLLKYFLLDVSMNSERNKVRHRKLVLNSTELETRWFCYVTAVSLPCVSCLDSRENKGYFRIYRM